LNQTQYTADGNHHSNKYSKNTDPDDVSLYNGTAYFPEDAAYREFVRNIPNTAPEVNWGSLIDGSSSITDAYYFDRRFPVTI